MTEVDTMTSRGHDVIMTEVLNVAEAKRRFSELIDRVGRGERFVVARRGKPVLALVPAHEAERETREPRGLLSFVGALGDEGDEFYEIMMDVYRSRRKARGRPVPEIE